MGLRPPIRPELVDGRTGRVCELGSYAKLPRALVSPGLLIPAYFSPEADAGRREWGRLGQAASRLGPGLMAVANPSNGPGRQRSASYAQVTAGVKEAGGRVLGYVHTCYGNRHRSSCCPRPAGAVEEDIRSWRDWYGVEGIFFDEVSSSRDDVELYRRWIEQAGSGSEETLSALNFGVVPDPPMMDLRPAVLGVMEDACGEGEPNWPRLSPRRRSRSLFLLHGVPAARCQELAEKVVRAGVGWLCLTDGVMPNPWDVLPAYFEDLVGFISECRSQISD